MWNLLCLLTALVAGTIGSAPGDDVCSSIPIGEVEVSICFPNTNVRAGGTVEFELSLTVRAEQELYLPRIGSKGEEVDSRFLPIALWRKGHAEESRLIPPDYREVDSPEQLTLVMPGDSVAGQFVYKVDVLPGEYQIKISPTHLMPAILGRSIWAEERYRAMKNRLWRLTSERKVWRSFYYDIEVLQAE